MDFGALKWPELIALASATIAFLSLLVAGGAFLKAREANQFIRQQNLPTGYLVDGWGGEGWIGMRLWLDNPGSVPWRVEEIRIRVPKRALLAGFWDVAVRTSSGSAELEPPRDGQARMRLSSHTLLKPGEGDHVNLVSPESSLRGAREVRMSVRLRAVATPRRRLSIEITMLRTEQARDIARQS